MTCEINTTVVAETVSDRKKTMNVTVALTTCTSN
jgi:hypothetical protein